MEDTGGSELKRPWSGKQLESLLRALSRAIEIVLEKQAEESISKSVKAESKKCLAKELKANLCVGINNVSRALERMPAKPADTLPGEPQPKRLKTVDNIAIELETLGQQRHPRRANITPLQPRVLMLPIRGGDGGGSLKLGEVLGTRAAIAIGIKEGDTPINWAVESITESGTS